MFTEKEREYIRSQRLGRLGTVADDNQVDVSPIGYDFDGEYFLIGGMANPKTRKYKNVQQGNNKVAVAIDDIVNTDPWQVRGIKVFGTAEIVEHKGYAGSGSYLRVTPNVHWSWGIEDETIKDGKAIMNKVVW